MIKKKIKENFNSMGGQVVLMILLVSALVLTMGLSISKNTVTETKIDTDEDLLKQAFNTAESGVEYYLSTGEKQYASGDSNASVTTMNIGGSGVLNSGGAVLNGKPFLFWLTNHNDDGTVGDEVFNGTVNKICVDDSFTGALKIDLISLSGSTYSISRLGYNIKSYAVNSFTRIDTNCINPINVTGGMLLAVTPIGGNTNLLIDGNINFPSQGEEITSIGQVANGVNTKVTVLNRFDEVPPFMLDTITSGNNVLSQ